MTGRTHDLHLLTGVYAVDALPDAEAAEFEKHLARCASCTEEVRGLREAAARLAMAAAIEPPPEMREQVLAAATRTRQLPAAGRRLLPFGAPRHGRWRLTVPRPVAVAAVTAMAAAIVVLVFLQVATSHRLQQTQTGNQAIAAVLAAPDARIQSAGSSVGGTVTAVISVHDQEAVITTGGMPAPPGSRVYQLWVISGSGARSAGLLPAARSGTTTPVLASGVRPGDRLGITIEPTGGSTQPTTTPVVLVQARA
jgi:anti-sigma-K factor RskA